MGSEGPHGWMALWSRAPTYYQRFSHSPSRISSKLSQLSETFPGAVVMHGPARTMQGNSLSMGYSGASVSISAQSLCQIPVPLRHMRAATSRKLLCAKRWLEKELLLTVSSQTAFWGTVSWLLHHIIFPPLLLCFWEIPLGHHPKSMWKHCRKQNQIY